MLHHHCEKALEFIKSKAETFQNEQDKRQYNGAILELIYSIALGELLDGPSRTISVAECITYAENLLEDNNEWFYEMALKDFINELNKDE